MHNFLNVSWFMSLSLCLPSPLPLSHPTSISSPSFNLKQWFSKRVLRRREMVLEGFLKTEETVMVDKLLLVVHCDRSCLMGNREENQLGVEIRTCSCQHGSPGRPNGMNWGPSRISMPRMYTGTLFKRATILWQIGDDTSADRPMEKKFPGGKKFESHCFKNLLEGQLMCISKFRLYASIKKKYPVARVQFCGSNCYSSQ